MIIRNARAEMMNVMKSDIAGEPLQHFRQLIKRTPLEGCSAVIPILGSLPVSSLELMLNVEQPDAGRTSDHHHECLQEQISLQAENPAHGRRNQYNPKIGKPH